MKLTLKRTIAVFVAMFAMNISGIISVEASEVDVLINKMVEKGILTRLDAETVRTDIENQEKARFIELRKETNPWLEGLTSKGDIRLRLEGFDFDETNRKDRLRERVRLRWGLEKKFNEEWKAGFRVSSGPTDEAISTNQSLDDQFQFKNLHINRAYGIWTPTERFQEIVPAAKHIEIGAGKVANPYKKWGTSLVWDGDVEPEGIYEKFDFNLTEFGKKGSWTLHALLGQWVIEEESSRKDVNMQSYGIGTKVKSSDGKAKLFANYTFYDWQDYDSVLRSCTGEIDSCSGSSLGTSPAGNDLNTDAFKIHSWYIEGSLKEVETGLFGKLPAKVFFQHVHNSEEGTAVANPGNDDAWTAGFQLGKAKKKGTGQFKYQYYEVEANSTVGDFSESDLGTGGTNKEGHKFQFKYQITDAIQLAWTNWLIDDIINTSTTVDREVWRSQLDTIFKF